MEMLASQKDTRVQYHGHAGMTQSCLSAIVGVIQSGERIERAYILTAFERHGFAIKLEVDGIIFVKTGFTSGYPGEGPAGLASALHLLRRHRVDIDEINVSSLFLDRLDGCRLTVSDLSAVTPEQVIRPARYGDYMYGPFARETGESYAMRKLYPPIVPFGIIDDRIVDLAVSLSENADSALMTAYRRLEEIVVKRCGLAGVSGARVFSKAFQADDSVLTWDTADPAEAKGRAALFFACFSAYRNRRAHKELQHSDADVLREFLLLNELYVLESEAILREERSA
ncbi:TIGR02391 family protein [Pseudoxanthomonas sacheonensis]|uniref:Conserved hypothetical protein CHP02391 domain-containing protein n=1 Tax=Pseudoxanthomonas sacheonensis TaxID=443615 RepID=A0ABU1RQI1_9GAMM|nr:TIGR02391 family protein [Pseudoxanthomonas sacheonensis]MDR6841023.1 hypothetical protein [Pseudoxanthomonas sacheonensis]